MNSPKWLPLGTTKAAATVVSWGEIGPPPTAGYALGSRACSACAWLRGSAARRPLIVPRLRRRPRPRRRPPRSRPSCWARYVCPGEGGVDAPPALALLRRNLLLGKPRTLRRAGSASLVGAPRAANAAGKWRMESPRPMRLRLPRAPRAPKPVARAPSLAPWRLPLSCLSLQRLVRPRLPSPRARPRPTELSMLHRQTSRFATARRLPARLRWARSSQQRRGPSRRRRRRQASRLIPRHHTASLRLALALLHPKLPPRLTWVLLSDLRRQPPQPR